MKLFSKNSNLCDQSTGTSRIDGRTDRLTNNIKLTALGVASRGKNSIFRAGLLPPAQKKSKQNNETVTHDKSNAKRIQKYLHEGKNISTK